MLNVIDDLDRKCSDLGSTGDELAEPSSLDTQDNRAQVKSARNSSNSSKKRK